MKKFEELEKKHKAYLKKMEEFFNDKISWYNFGKKVMNDFDDR
jgi:adenylosuccinate synthase